MLQCQFLVRKRQDNENFVFIPTSRGTLGGECRFSLHHGLRVCYTELMLLSLVVDKPLGNRRVRTVPDISAETRG